MFGKAARNREEVVTLPDGSQVTLDRAFSEYTMEELARLGITPGLGGGAIVTVATRGNVDARVPRLVATAAAILSGIVVGIVVALWRVPMSGSDTLPRECNAVFGNVVTCGSGPVGFAFAAGAALILGTVTYVAVRRRPSRKRAQRVAPN